jgi:hypothetical protein
MKLKINELPKLISQYRGYIQDPEGNAIELLDKIETIV